MYVGKTFYISIEKKMQLPCVGVWSPLGVKIEP